MNHFDGGNTWDKMAVTWIKGRLQKAAKSTVEVIDFEVFLLRESHFKPRVIEEVLKFV